jgi:hypothetical protein
MILTEKISIHVTPEAAQAFQELSKADRKKLGFLLNFHLLDATRAHSSLNEIMREINKNAKHRDLTPEILNDLLT